MCVSLATFEDLLICQRWIVQKGGLFHFFSDLKPFYFIFYISLWMEWNRIISTLNPENYNINTQVMAEVKDEVVESDRLQNEMLQGEVTLYTIF